MIHSCYMLQYLHISKIKQTFSPGLVSQRKVHFLSENTAEWYFALEELLYANKNTPL